MQGGSAYLGDIAVIVWLLRRYPFEAALVEGDVWYRHERDLPAYRAYIRSQGKCGRDVLVMTFQVMTPKRTLRGSTSATSGVRSAESPQSIPEFFSISNAIDNDFLLRPSLILRQHAQSSGEGGSMPADPMTISRCSDAAAAPTTK